MTHAKAAIVLFAASVLCMPSAYADNAPWRGPIIDAHSQIDQHVDLGQVISMLDDAGVSRVILAARGKVKPGQIARLARTYPDRITASVRTKGRTYADNHPKFYKLLKAQRGMPEFRAMAEIILWHARKGNKAPKWVVAASSPQVQAALNLVYERGWPAVLHYEFRAAGGETDGLMSELVGLLRAKPAQPYVLTHMGQVDLDQARTLLENHTNLHFIPSWSNSITTPLSKQPWTNLFDGRRLSAAWQALIIKYPNQFILGFDNVFDDHWGDLYVRQVGLWREALAALPGDVAHAVAHGNAERLWKLDPLP